MPLQEPLDRLGEARGAHGEVRRDQTAERSEQRGERAVQAGVDVVDRALRSGDRGVQIRGQSGESCALDDELTAGDRVVANQLGFALLRRLKRGTGRNGVQREVDIGELGDESRRDRPGEGIDRSAEADVQRAGRGRAGADDTARTDRSRGADGTAVGVGLGILPDHTERAEVDGNLDAAGHGDVHDAQRREVQGVVVDDRRLRAVIDRRRTLEVRDGVEVDEAEDRTAEERPRRVRGVPGGGVRGRHTTEQAERGGPHHRGRLDRRPPDTGAGPQSAPPSCSGPPGRCPGRPPFRAIHRDAPVPGARDAACAAPSAAFRQPCEPFKSAMYRL